MPLRKTTPILTLASLILAATALSGANATPVETPEQQADQAKTAASITSDTVQKETDRLIVTFKDGTSTNDKQAAVTEADQKTDALTDTKIVKNEVATDTSMSVIETKDKLDASEQQDAIESLEQDPRVQKVEPDLIVKAMATDTASTGTVAAASTWTSNQLNATNAQRIATGRGITVGELDTGSTNHPDLTGHRINGIDLISDETYGRDGQPGRDWDPSDTGDWGAGAYSNWHGTHVEGDMHMSAPEATTKHFRILGNSGSGYISDFADGITAAAGGNVPGFSAQKPVDVINMSVAWTASTCPTSIQTAIDFAHSKNIPVVVAAGNNGANTAGYAPANCPGAIVVGATTAWNALTSYSNLGAEVDVVAPGGTVGAPVVSTSNTGLYGPVSPTYAALNGTSMATPQVTGVIALMKQVNPSITVEQVRKILVSTGTNIQGYRQVNADAAVQQARAIAQPIFHLVPGSGIEWAYNTTGGVSKYGSPTINEFATRDGGVAQNFEKGYTFYWTPWLGAHAVNFNGAIGSRYAATGFENGYGYPTMDESSAARGGAYQRFQGADRRTTTLYWSNSTGTHTVWNPGAIGSKFEAAGGTNNWGHPTMDEESFNQGAKQTFLNLTTDGETVAYWSADTGAHIMNLRGGIFNTWKNGGGALTYGFPITDETGLANGGAQVMYQATGASNRTAIVWSARSGSHVMNGRGAFYNEWIKNISKYGYPTSDETGSNGVSKITFANGYTMTWTAWSGLSVSRS